jgi:hypothetical protein
MREGKPGRVFVAERLGAGDYAAGAALFDAKLAEARAGWLRMDRWKSVAALAVVIVAAALAVAVLALLGRHGFGGRGGGAAGAAVRRGLVPGVGGGVCPFWPPAERGGVAGAIMVGEAMARWFGLSHRCWRRFAGFAARKIIAVAGGVELDPRLFEDRLWPLLFSPDDQDRSEPRAANMATAALRSPLKRLHCRRKPCGGWRQEATADLRHPFQRVPTKQGRHGSRNA